MMRILIVCGMISALMTLAVPANARIQTDEAALKPVAAASVQVPEGAIKLYERGWSLMQQQEYKKAARAFSRVVKKYSTTAYASKAQFGVGEALYRRGKVKKAFEAFQRLIDKYPASGDLGKALERQFAIADLYYNNQPGEVPVVKLRVPARRKPAIEYYQKIVENAPFSRYAEVALYRIGRIYDDYNKYDDAVAGYERFLERFPQSSHAQDALYRLGRCYVSKAFGTRYDEVSLEKATAAFERYLRNYPEGEKAGEIRATLAQLDEKQAYGNYRIAAYYDKQKKYAAAKVYYQQVIDKHPGSSWATLAKKRLAALADDSADTIKK